jgi:hypothetical protein
MAIPGKELTSEKVFSSFPFFRTFFDLLDLPLVATVPVALLDIPTTDTADGAAAAETVVDDGTLI